MQKLFLQLFKLANFFGAAKIFQPTYSSAKLGKL